jgi:flagellar biosynthesis protein FliQ
MVDDATLDLVRQSLVISMKIMFPILAAGIVIGLIISIFQSVTSIQEQTLALIPKIFVMIVVSLALLPWIAIRLAEFAIEMFTLH